LEWDLRDACENLTTVLQRHEEAFHETLRALSSEEIAAIIRQTAEVEKAERGEGEAEGIATIHGHLRIKPGVRLEDLRVDRHRRLGGLTWIAPATAAALDPDAFAREARLLDGAWTLLQGGDDGQVELSVEHAGWRIRRALAPIDGGPGLLVRYRIDPPGEGGPWLLASEWNLLVGHTGDDLAPDGGSTGAGREDGAQAAGGRDGVEQMRFLGGGGRALEVDCAPGASVGWSPVHTISSSEGGLEKTGQGTVFLFAWRVAGPMTAQLRLRPQAPRCEDASV
jgi:hypothetical protein